MCLRALIVVLGLVITPIPVHAQDVETLRREIEQLKRQLETTQQQYQRAIEALTERLQRIEARPVAAAPPSDPSNGGITLPSLLDHTGALLALRADRARSRGLGAGSAARAVPLRHGDRRGFRRQLNVEPRGAGSGRDLYRPGEPGSPA